MPRTPCKHCGEPAEVAAGLDNTPVVSDSCYACRNFWKEVNCLVSGAAFALQKAQAMLDQRGGDNHADTISDQIARDTQGIPTLTRAIEEIYLK